MQVNPRDLQPVATADVALGQPLEHAIFNRHGKLLLAAGQIVSTERQLEILAEEGLYFNPRWHASFTSTNIQRGSGQATLPESVKRRASGVRSADQALSLTMYFDQDGVQVRLLGSLPRKSLMVTAPSRDGQLMFVKEGQTYRFRAMHGGVIYAFETTVAKTVFSPFPYLHLEWPDARRVEKKRVRGARRADVELPCTAYVGDDDPPRSLTGLVYDLSVGGAAIRLPQEALGTQTVRKLAFRLVVGTEKLTLELPCRETKREYLDDGSTSLGVMFESVPRESYLALHSTVHEQLLHQAENPLFQGE